MEKISNAFPAFKYKNYRIYFSAQIISLIGNWMQVVAQGYLVFQLTHSAFAVGVVAALGHLPTTLFALIGGTLVDRFPRNKLLKTTQFLQFVLATILGFMVLSGDINVFTIAIFAFLMGTVNAVDQPARISNVAYLVEKKDIYSAQAMNMATFNSARVIGPAIAGWLIYAFGIGWAFLLNGISYLAPFIAYNFIDFGSPKPQTHKSTWGSIKEGLRYAYNHKFLRTLLLYMVIVSIFGFSYTTLLPVIAEQVFAKDAQGLGLLFSSAGLGAILGALFSSAFSRKLHPTKTILWGGMIFSASLFAFSLNQDFNLALILLFLAGFGMITQNAIIQASIQKNVDDFVRGRVASIQSLAFLGMTPIGSFFAGVMAQHYGTQLTVGFGAIVIFFAAIILHFKLSKLI